ncbi:MAG: hypothetical protein IPP83_10530 [Flavobacteriales bacterium]|nr:hypothetical protein [Flavobacteriales bacterium]
MSALVVMSLVLCLAGCVAFGEASLARGALSRAALRGAARSEIALLERSGLRLAGGEVVIADAATFRSTMAGIRMRGSVFGRPQLYMSGESTAFAEVVNPSTVRMFKTNQHLRLPGELRVVTGNRVNVRVGPGQEYHAFRQLNPDQIVLVEAVQPGWCRVRIGEEFGWIAAALLATLSADDQWQQH